MDKYIFDWEGTRSPLFTLEELKALYKLDSSLLGTPSQSDWNLSDDFDAWISEGIRIGWLIKLPEELITDLEEIADDDLQDELSTVIADYLSDKYGYCVNSFATKITVEISSIDWDLKE